MRQNVVCVCYRAFAGLDPGSLCLLVIGSGSQPANCPVDRLGGIKIICGRFFDEIFLTSSSFFIHIPSSQTQGVILHTRMRSASFFE